MVFIHNIIKNVISRSQVQRNYPGANRNNSSQFWNMGAVFIQKVVSWSQVERNYPGAIRGNSSQIWNMGVGWIVPAASLI